MRPVRVQKLESTDAFVVVDLDDVPGAAGVVRLAPKVLVDGATLLARTVTYTFASFGVQRGGASAGINAAPDGRDEAVAAFVSELADDVAAGRLAFAAGLGLRPVDLEGFGTAPPDPTLAGWGAVVAAAAAGGALDGRKVVVVGAGPEADAAVAAAAEAGAAVERAALDAPGDVLMVAGKAGVLGYDAATTVQAGMVVPLTPVPVTARALAELERHGTVVLPDFVTTAAPLLAAYDPEGGDPLERVAAAAGELATPGDGDAGVWLAGAQRAEQFLRTWQDPLPFGRPLA
jgi:glutamate dehydrogenase/leucine dehydrogenase